MVFGRTGNNPFCHHRALELLREGKRERLVLETPAEGKPFDPNFHEAVAQVDSETQAPGTVATVFQRGYMAGNKLLRPAMVSVVRARPQSPPDSTIN